MVSQFGDSSVEQIARLGIASRIRGHSISLELTRLISAGVI
jgi:hypothetical protein